MPGRPWDKKCLAIVIATDALTVQGRKTGFAWHFHQLSRANGPEGHSRKSGLQDQTTRQRQRREKV
jgi:hypothetical protein